jgi:phage FluMu gp28-like protein
MLTDKWYADEFPPFKREFEDKTIVIPRDADVKDDLRAVQVIGGTPRIPKTTGQGSKGERRHGDAAVALLMMRYAARRDRVEIDYTPAPAKGSAWDEADDFAFAGGGAW